MRRPEESREEARLVDDAARAFEAGELESALSCADAAVAFAPRSVPGHHYRAAALAEMGRLAEADAAYARALELSEDDLDLLLGAADFYVNVLQDPDGDRESLERGLRLARRGAQRARRGHDTTLAAEFALLEGIALSQLGDSRAALAQLDLALEAMPGNPDATLERGFALYELCRFDEAREQLEALLRLSPDEVWAHHTLGLVAERRGDAREAERRFGRARKLAPDEFPKPVSLSQAAFDAAVEDALASLPEQVRRYLSNVAIAVEDLPADEDLLGSDPPLSPSILGIFRGSSYGEKGSMDPWSHFPSSIVLYQRNLQRFARDRKELIEQIGITLIHEVGHFLGLDEHDLWERGLE